MDVLRDLVAAQPMLFAGCAAIVVFLGVAYRGSMRRDASTDPRRLFTADERAAGFARAGGQCEYARWFVFRCTRTATHGDHYYPWSKGGATTMRNFVAACPECNLTKGARVPSALDRAMLSLRRGRYFPSHIPLEAGERVTHGVRVAR